MRIKMLEVAAGWPCPSISLFPSLSHQRREVLCCLEVLRLNLLMQCHLENCFSIVFTSLRITIHFYNSHLTHQSPFSLFQVGNFQNILLLSLFQTSVIQGEL